MDRISKKSAFLIVLGLLALIVMVVSMMQMFTPSPPSGFAKVSETVQTTPQEQDPMAELQKLLDAGKAKPVWKVYLSTYWPAAVGAGVFVGLVAVVMRLLKRRRLPDDDGEGIPAMVDEDAPKPVEETRPPAFTMGDEKRVWPWSKIGFVSGAFVLIFVVYSALYSFSTLTGLKSSVEEIKKEMVEKVGRGSFDSLGTTVADLKSATDELTTKVGDARGRLVTAETKLNTVAATADEAHSIASRTATKVVRLDEKASREVSAIHSRLNTHFKMINEGFSRQDSINTQQKMFNTKLAEVVRLDLSLQEVGALDRVLARSDSTRVDVP